MKKKEDLYYPSEEFKKGAWLKDGKIYREAEKDPLKFWEKLAEELFWFRKWKKVFEYKPPYFKWFLGGKLNITSNIFEKNRLGWGKLKKKIALIWEPEPPAEKSRTFTYEKLFKEVCKFANALKKLGVKKGDRVGIYLPMIPEAVVSMLACARIGAVHIVIFSAFSPAALKTRLKISGARVLITADGYFRKGQTVNLKQNADEGIKGTEVEKIVVVERAKNKIPRNSQRDRRYEDLIKREKDFCKPEIMDSEDTLFILPESGTGGEFLPILHTAGGYAVQAYWTGKWVFDFHNKDIMWCTADVGWVTSHTYGCYSPLLNGITTLFFEGAPDWPEPDRWAQIIEKRKVTIFYTAPTAIRMFEKYGAEILKKYEFKTLRLLGSVGEPIDESAWVWYFKEVGRGKCPLVDTWWQTESGGILISSLPGIGPFKPAFVGLPFPGTKFDILDEKGKSLPPNQAGNLVMLPPFAPGQFRRIYKDPKKYSETYRKQDGKKVYFTSDGALKDENGLIKIIGRVDDIIKVAGHRLSAGELENAISKHPDIIECAVIGVPDEIKGEVPTAFVVLEKKVEARPQSELKKEVVGQIRKEIGPIALLKEIYLVEDLPKTRSGKIMRRILRKLRTGEELGDTSTLANPESIEKIRRIIKNEKNFNSN